MRTLTRAGTLLSLTLGLGALPSPAPAEGDSPPPAPVVEERARQWLHDMSEYLRASKSYSFHADIQYDDVLPSGQKIAFAAETDIALRRPNGIHARQVSDTGSKRLWFDGKQLTLLDPQKNTVGVEALSGNTDKALEYMVNELHFSLPLADFLYEDPARALGHNTRYGFVVGPSSVGGIPCQHLAFVDSHVDWQIWIEDGRLPLPRKLVITYKTLPSSPQFSATLSDWDFGSRLPDSLFQASLPADAMRIPFLKEAQARPPTPEAKPKEKQ